MADTSPSRWARLPLSRRLVVGLLAVMAVALVVVASATYVALRAWMTEQIDANLMQPKQRLYAEQNDRGRVGEAVQSWTSAGATVVVVDSSGTATPLQQSYPGAPTPQPLSDSDAAQLAGVPTSPNASPVSVSVDDLGSSRAVAVPAFTNGQPVTVVAVLPLSRVDQIAGRLVVVEIVAVGLALLFVGVIGTWFVRRSLRPLQEVAETAGEVASLPLERGDVVIPARVQAPIPTTEVGQVGLAVNAMLDHVESSLQTRADTEDRLRRFVSDAGHELRTPLAAVRGYSELMRRGAGADPEQARLAAERIEAAASRMGLLVEDLLLLASLDEERPLSRDRLDLRALVDEAVAEAATAGPDHQWSVVGEEVPVPVVGDGTRLHQAIANLLANARAHTPPGTQVRTSVAMADGWAYVDVLDDGPGFPVDLLPRATERFTRGDASRSRATGGSGLGLSIVKAVVDAHGGGLMVTNAPSGTGALVRIRLPLAPAPAFAPPPQVPVTAPPA
ncbi:MAG: HAMP domain-containing sensor histidine kinase [Candidatus Nanopelagicales bacterium]